MRRAIAVLRIGCAFWGILGGAGCASTEPSPKEPLPPPKPPQRAVPLVAKTSQELGGVDPAAVKKAFTALDDKFTECQKRALDRVEVVAGGVKFFLRIGSDGSAKWSYIEVSELGDHETEKCLVDAVLAARWPKPDSGDAEVRYSMELPLQATRPPNDWSADRIAGALGKNSDAIDKCKGGAKSSFHATMYVGPGGKVLAAGMGVPDKDGQDQADCLAKTLLKMKGLPSPGSWPAKVSFDL
jgi:hypothetical protein